MLTVEDLLVIIARRLCEFPDPFHGLLEGGWYDSFVMNVLRHVEAGKPLSTEQAKIVLKMAGRVRDRLVALGDVVEQEIDDLLANPRYRQTPYQSTSIRKEVRYLGDNKLGFRFKFNELLIRDLRRLNERGNAVAAYFDRDHRIWVVSVTRQTLEGVGLIISAYRFEMDEEAREYLSLCHRSLNRPSTFVLDEENEVIVANVADNEVLACWVARVAGGIPV